MSVLLAAAVAARLAASPSNLPVYPGGTVERVAGVLLITTSDPPAKVRDRYGPVWQKAGWTALSAPPIQTTARFPGTLLSFEKGDRAADVWITSGLGTSRRPVTVLMVLETSPSPTTGGSRGRPAR